MNAYEAVMMACSPSTPTIWVWIPLKSTVLFCELFEKNEANKKEAVMAHLKKEEMKARDC